MNAVSSEDELGIRALYARAIHAFDVGDASWLDFWDDDPHFEFAGDEAAGRPAMVLDSREALSTMIGQFQAATQGRGLHHFTNFTFDAVDDGVRVRAYILMIVNGESPMSPASIMQNMRIDDLVVLRDDRWLFKRRSVGASW
jgi:hypothetical protein